jgi:hypothetical protein
MFLQRAVIAGALLNARQMRSGERICSRGQFRASTGVASESHSSALQSTIAAAVSRRRAYIGCRELRSRGSNAK